jgi:hypothetical protein
MASTCNCLRLLPQLEACALALALLKAGKSIAARMAMIAMTTRSSTRVKALAQRGLITPAQGETRVDAWAWHHVPIEFIACEQFYTENGAANVDLTKTWAARQIFVKLRYVHPFSG